jgi:deazaflavin-dependent oxidoreductase (nitroreductase family)
VALVSAADAWWGGGMTLPGTYEPSPSDWVREQVEKFEASNGQEANTLNGDPIVVITSIGAKSGKLRKNPVMRVEHDGSYAAVASKGGAPEHPAWYANFVAYPQVELQDGPRKWDMSVRQLSGAERVEWWDRSVAAFPNYADYQRKTDREIPVFLLEPIAEIPL